VGGAVGAYLGGKVGNLFGSKSGKKTSKIADSPYEGVVQKYLPFALRYRNVDPYLGAGVEGIGNLIRNPGSLSPDVADAIRMRLASESENIAQNYRGIGANQAGAGARGNVPISIRTALDSALNTQQERAQREARRGALADSESLRRQDLGQTYNLLNTILQFMQSGKGQAIQGFGSAGVMEQNTKGTELSALGSIISSLANMRTGGGSGAGGAAPLAGGGWAGNGWSMA
jgi:hypothetical protein